MYSQVAICPRRVYVQGVSLTEIPRTEIPLDKTSSMDRDPPDRESPWTETPWTEFPHLTETPAGQRPPPRTETTMYGKERAVRILLECIFVLS